ncbi:MAG: cell division protein ZapA [Treponema sp.]|nr:cell division protein ZapA [Treponema sp.]
MGNLQIDVLGTSFTIRANEDSEYLTRLLGYYKRIVNEIEQSGSLKDPLQISVLAGITLCDDLYKEKGRNAKFQNALEKNSADIEADRINKLLIEKLDKVLK